MDTKTYRIATKDRKEKAGTMMTRRRDWRRTDADGFYMRRATPDSGWNSQQGKARQGNMGIIIKASRNFILTPRYL